MIADKYLICDVSDVLHHDPKIHSEAIGVDVEHGVVTLRGTVGSPREKHEARKAAGRVHGVVSVDNQLQVRPMDDRTRKDDEIRANVLEALLLDGLVPATIDAKVEDGVATLTGTAAWQYERDEALQVASNIVGGLDVIDEIELWEQIPRPADI